MGLDSYNFDSEYSVEEIKLDIYVLIKCNHPNVVHYFSERGQGVTSLTLSAVLLAENI
jgi:hypothetical protein